MRAVADTAYVPELAIRESEGVASSRHTALVRVTHWITTLSFLSLLVSGILILIAHPRLYWGETGGVGAPSLIDLPIPFKIGYSGWGRYVHFLSAWVSVLAGLVYLFAGLYTRHFSRNMLPARSDLAWTPIWRSVLVDLHMEKRTEEESSTYNVLQKLAYLFVVFVLFPLVILSGLGMSPAIASVFPVLVNSFGGQQSARTVHFFVASFLVLFFFVHILMVSLAGFASRVRAMIIGP
jgi:thiosulfate reductase cytochrome b subunit